MKQKPIFGDQPFGKRDARLLLITYFDPNGIETIPQSIVAWQSLSRHEIVLYNMWPGRNGAMRLPYDLDLNAFDGLIIHPPVSYSPAIIAALDEEMSVPFAAFDGVKILMKQDEQVKAGMLAQLVRDKGFDIVCTCVPPREQEKVYPRGIVGADCNLIQTYTGYVSPDMRSTRIKGRRPLEVTYRGSIQPLEFGRLGYEKRGIGYDMVAALKDIPDINYDISSRWQDRLSGAAWNDFLTHSAVVLGAESGSNIFDFDGTVSAWCREYEKRASDTDPVSYEYYRQAHEEFLHLYEGNVHYAQISPRHFETAAAGAAQLLYEGEYSGLFKPGRHFFPLKKDLSNLDAVLDFLRDKHAQRHIVECAFEEIILDRDNWYESFIETMDGAIDAKLIVKGRRRVTRPQAQGLSESRQKRTLAYVLCAHDPSIDPRIEWFSKSLAETHNVVIVGTYPFNKKGNGPLLKETEDGIRILRVERTQYESEWLPLSGDLRIGKPSQARALLSFLMGYALAPDKVLRQRLGAQTAVANEISRFRELCNYMVNTNSALTAAIEKLGPPNLVVAADLEALFAAVSCGETTGARVVFDAHEYWPWSYTDFQHWEIEFWSAMEGKLAALTDLNVTVTPQLADSMSHEYGVAFRALPNAVTRREGDLKALEEAFARRASGNGPLQVLFQGGFAHGRGLEEVIRAWSYLRSDARLILRGPDNDYRRALIGLARSMGLGEERVSFPPAVPEDKLVATALDADIGLIPYNPVWFGYRYCCPNKLSQYAAAGLPILSSMTEFVAETVKENGIGHVVDIANPEQLASYIDLFANERVGLVEMGRRARAFFETTFNWDALAEPVMAELRSLQKDTSPRSADFHWISRLNTQMPSLHQREKSKRNVTSFEEGASLIDASAFSPFPNDAAYLLRQPKPGGYAAALEGTALPHWIEVDLGAPHAAGALEVDWYDDDNYATCYRILGKSLAGAEWHLLAEVPDNSSSSVRHSFAPVSFRYLRLEASAFMGQERMLIRALRTVTADAEEDAIPAIGTDISSPITVDAISYEKPHLKRTKIRIMNLVSKLSYIHRLWRKAKGVFFVTR